MRPQRRRSLRNSLGESYASREEWLKMGPAAGSICGATEGISHSEMIEAIYLTTMILSTVVAWLIARTDMPGRNAFEFLCWFAYFVPDFPLVLAWILILDPNFGVLNTAVKFLPFVEGPLFNPYSFWGIIWVHTSVSGIWFKV